MLLSTEITEKTCIIGPPYTFIYCHEFVCRPTITSVLFSLHAYEFVLKLSATVAPSVYRPYNLKGMAHFLCNVPEVGDQI